MSLAITPVTPSFSTCAQISADDIAEIAALGFKTIVNNRPDHESGETQPTNASIQQAAEAAGLHYVYIPVIPNDIKPADIEAYLDTMPSAPTPILGFCRTGRRAGNLFSLAQQVKPF